MTDGEFKLKITLLKRLGIAAAVGLMMFIMVFIISTPDNAPLFLIFCIFVLMVPSMIYLFLLTLWHWKSRYRGTHSNLWGGLLVLETSGWCKLIYLFRHIIPDARGHGRYAIRSNSTPPESHEV